MPNKALRRGLAQCRAPREQALRAEATGLPAADAEQPPTLGEHRHGRHRPGLRGHALPLRQAAGLVIVGASLLPVTLMVTVALLLLALPSLARYVNVVVPSKSASGV